MKKILYFAMIISLSFATSCSKNKDVPTWDTALGKAKFATAQTWTISGQVWSDVVEIVGAKNNYEGGNSTDGYKIDFRANKLGYKGSLFSWRAVAETANLCPPPWRVPIQQDFVNLDIAMCGGDGGSRTNPSDLSIYLDTWGGAFGGYCSSDGTLRSQGSWANYWSATEYNATSARYLYFGTSGSIYPQNWYFKYYGLTLRCVRN